MPRKKRKGANPPRVADLAVSRAEALPRRLFHEACKRQKCHRCLASKARGNARGAVQSHHVVYKQTLEKRGLSLWNTRNAMPLCKECHDLHHAPNGQGKMDLALLTDDHIAYAFEVLGTFAYDWLRSRYAGEDERVTSRLEAA